MSFIANYLASNEEKQELTDIFKQFDTNGDGQLSKEELIHGYSKLYKSKERALIEVDQILANVDLNKNGIIDYSGNAHLFLNC